MATRVKSDSGIVDPTRIEDFDSMLRKLRSPTITEDEFSRTASRMHKEFPAAFKWLGWWLRPSHIGMIFPSMSAVDPSVRAQVPHTSNTVEHIHSLLNQAVGKGNTLMDGIMKIFRFVKKFESDDAAIHGEISIVFMNALVALTRSFAPGGYYTPQGPREKRAPKKVKFITNDSRGPDTAAAIQGLEPSNMGVSILTLPLFPTAYQWDGVNSCFIDHGQELAFREYCLWKEEDRTRCRTLLSTESFLFKTPKHFDFRLKLLTGVKKKDKKAEQRPLAALHMHQTVTLDVFFSKWRPKADRKSYQCALTWLQPSMEVRPHTITPRTLR
jgi:hypothetical protein